MPPRAFISGPLSTGPSQTYFKTHYIPKINTAIAKGHHFVIGPIPSGVDKEALEYLLSYPVPPAHITIFVTSTEDRMWGDMFRARGVRVHVVEGWEVTSGDRDAAMTAASVYDILRWRTEEEARAFYGSLYREGHVTNTERNWLRRVGEGSLG
ncbi:hypothetical protein BDV25DRAFT_135866 [Aspergillus avenaceus]|uniref:Uncharacterized protein n=1 Tax=Aspergillus avenaceus TaxID=36643 RepID=A0A5N6U754_ASPAV|nr:hypothetical protein BDV25DRAFT_135866 [Aspergillus avenaceus]